MSNASPFELSVVVAREEATDKTKNWKLDGSTHVLTVTHDTSVDEIKRQMEQRMGLPVHLQKLKFAARGVFLRDGETCAAVNLRQGDVLDLVRAQRGGKKK